MIDAASSGIIFSKGPQKLYGHRSLVERFLSSLHNQSLHHAWVLAGPQGIGKRLTAETLARFLLRYPQGNFPLSLPTEIADDVFTQTQEKTHPDFMVLEKGEDTLSQSKTFITVDAIRHMNHQLHRTTISGGWKVIIIDSCDDLNEKAANALLKILEEPPGQTVFFLLHHGVSPLPLTIRSRCHRITLSPLSLAEMDRVIEDKFPSMQEAEKSLAKILARGRVGIFQRLIENEGLLLFKDLIKGMGEVLSRNGPPYPFCFKLSEDIVKEGEKRAFLFSYLFSLCLQAVTESLATGIEASLSPLQEILKFSSLSLERWLSAQAEIHQILRNEQALKVDQKQTILSCFSILGRVK